MATATPGADYAETTGTINFASGETLRLVTIPIPNDQLKEPLERFQVRLSNASGAPLGARVTATVSIVDNDQGAEFTTSEAWVHEDLGGLELKVLRGSEDRLDPLTLDYVFTDITAKLEEDYHATNGTLQLAAGETSKTIWVPVVHDHRAEPDEQFRVQLANPSAGTHQFARLIETPFISPDLEPTDLNPRHHP